MKRLYYRQTVGPDVGRIAGNFRFADNSAIAFGLLGSVPRLMWQLELRTGLPHIMLAKLQLAFKARLGGFGLALQLRFQCTRR